MKQLRERVACYGAGNLATSELLFVILKAGASKKVTLEKVQELLAQRSLPQWLAADVGEFTHIFGETKAIQLVAVLELFRRLMSPSFDELYQIRTPQDAANLVMTDMMCLDHEEIRVLLLDTKNRVMANLLLYKGALHSSVLRVAEIFRPAITRNCSAILLCHNHPSGDLTPSPEDIIVTQELVKAGVFLNIEVVDHLIIGNNRFLSLKERLRW